MKLSVIIPVYQTADTLDHCLETVLGQTCTDMEVILVDDGSPDRSAALCDEWAARDSRIRVIHQPNRGLSAARNAGLDLCTGNYITFVDSDDSIAPDTYAPLVNKMEAHPDYDLIEYPAYIHHGSPHQHLLALPSRTYRDWKAYWIEARGYAHTYAWNKVYRHRLFQEIRYPEHQNFEDAATTPLLLQQCRVIAIADTGLYYYEANPQGITANASGKELAALLAAHNALLPLAHSADYYAHVLNIALDVYHATGETPPLVDLPYRHTLKLKLKHFLGLKRLCQIHKIRLLFR